MGIVKKYLASLKLTFSHLKMDVWNTIVSFWVPPYFQGLLLLVSRVPVSPKNETFAGCSHAAAHTIESPSSSRPQTRTVDAADPKPGGLLVVRKCRTSLKKA